MKNLVLSMKEKPLNIFDSRGAVSLMEVNLIHLIAMSFRKSFKFYSNLSFKRNSMEPFPPLSRQILTNWKMFLSTVPKISPVFCPIAYSIMNIFRWKIVLFIL